MFYFYIKCIFFYKQPEKNKIDNLCALKNMIFTVILFTLKVLFLMEVL